MSVLKITDQNFTQEILKSEQVVLVDFYADWCGPCQRMSPIIDEIEQEVDNIKVGKINVDENNDLAIKYGISTIPTIVIFKKGEIKKTFVGVIDKSEIINTVKKIIE